MLPCESVVNIIKTFLEVLVKRTDTYLGFTGLVLCQVSFKPVSA